MSGDGNHSPNFLTCPAFPELEPPKDSKPPEPSEKKDVPPPVEPPKAQRQRRPWKRWVILALAIVFLVLTIPPGIALGRAYLAARDAKAALERAKAHAQALDAGAAADDVASARDSVSDIRDALSGVGFWRDVPGIGSQVRALEDTATAGMTTLDGAHDIIAVFQVVTDALRGGAEATGSLPTEIQPTRRFQDLTPEEKRDLLRRFSDSLSQLRLAREKIDIALEIWNRVPQDRLFSPLRTAIKPLADNLPTLKQTIDEAVPLIETFVPMAGYPEPVRYLVLLQNSDEIRPGGGFIGNVGTMTVDAGELTAFDSTDVYNIDNPATFAWKEVPPAPMAKYLGVKAWFLRDANWSPDFPTSADKILDFYTRERAVAGAPVKDPPTAVLAFEPGFFKSLLAYTGPVSVDGKTYSADNFFDQIQYEVEMGFLKEGIPLEQRKELVSKVGNEIIKRLRQMPASRWSEGVHLLTTALERKQIMAYSKNPQLLSVLDARNWTGRIKGTDGDYLSVVDANLAALKTDGVMDKNVTYEVDAKDPARPIAKVTLKYVNTNQTITWRYTRYRSYTRIYVPDGSQLLDVTGASKSAPIDVMKELGKTVFGTFWVIEPGKTGTLTFRYQLPQPIASQIQSGKYKLLLDKQPGVDDTRLTLDLSFGKNILSATPAEPKDQWGDAAYRMETTTLQDRAFDIAF